MPFVFIARHRGPFTLSKNGSKCDGESELFLLVFVVFFFDLILLSISFLLDVNEPITNRGTCTEMKQCIFNSFGKALAKFHYRTQGKVTSSEASVCSQGEGADEEGLARPPLGRSSSVGRSPSRQKPIGRTTRQIPPLGRLHLVLPSSGDHCSGRYASYWNISLFL